MKTLNLSNYKIQELNIIEVQEINGGDNPIADFVAWAVCLLKNGSAANSAANRGRRHARLPWGYKV